MPADKGEAIKKFDRRFGNVPILRNLHISGDLKRSLLSDGGGIDLIHSHGLWRMPNIYSANAAKRHSIPHVISPRGMLSRIALDFSRASKALFWHAWQKRAVVESACLHATSISEYDEVRELGFRNPVAIIPNGVDMPPPPSAHPVLGFNDKREQRILLYIGRIHPKKGLDLLLAAWADLATDFPDWRLRIVGPGEAVHIREIVRIATALPRVSVEAPVFGEEKWHTFSNADLFVLPSYNENFGLTVAESLACSRPVIATKGTPWRGLETHRCGWWVESTRSSIEAALRNAMRTPSCVLDEMGARGAAWVKQAFSWGMIGVEMGQVYKWLCLGGPKPDCVVSD